MTLAGKPNLSHLPGLELMTLAENPAQCTTRAYDPGLQPVLMTLAARVFWPVARSYDRDLAGNICLNPEASVRKLHSEGTAKAERQRTRESAATRFEAHPDLGASL